MPSQSNIQPASIFKSPSWTPPEPNPDPTLHAWGGGPDGSPLVKALATAHTSGCVERLSYRVAADGAAVSGGCTAARALLGDGGTS